MKIQEAQNKEQGYEVKRILECSSKDEKTSHLQRLEHFENHFYETMRQYIGIETSINQGCEIDEDKFLNFTIPIINVKEFKNNKKKEITKKKAKNEIEKMTFYAIRLMFKDEEEDKMKIPLKLCNNKKLTKSNEIKKNKKSQNLNENKTKTKALNNQNNCEILEPIKLNEKDMKKDVNQDANIEDIDPNIKDNVEKVESINISLIEKEKGKEKGNQIKSTNDTSNKNEKDKDKDEETTEENGNSLFDEQNNILSDNPEENDKESNLLDKRKNDTNFNKVIN